MDNVLENTSFRSFMRKNIEIIEEDIQKLKKWKREIQEKEMLYSDDEQWFTEKIELIPDPFQYNQKKTQRLIGRINWKENFEDKDSGNLVSVDRSKIVRVDGEWFGTF